MKITNISFLLIYILISCKNRITNIVFERDFQNEKKIKSFVLFKENITEDTIYIYKPVSFKLINHTENRLRYKYSNQTSDLLFSLFFLNNKQFPKELYGQNVYLNSKKHDQITYYFKIPISKKEIQKYKDLESTLKSSKDSLSINLPKNINDNLEKKLAKGMIILSLTKDKYDSGVGIRYCFENKKTIIYDIDSLNKVNPQYKFTCD